MEHLIIKSNKGNLEIKWQDKNALAWYATQQAGCYFADLTNVNWDSADRFLPIHDKHFQNWNNDQWTMKEEMYVFDIPNDAKIIDIGSGASITDLLLYSYIPNSTFYLVDKDGEWPTTVSPVDVRYSEDHPFYHSWSTVLDGIVSSNFDRSRFNFLSPDNDFPENVDLIMSSYSYCFHYPKDQYWQRILNSLKKGGKLFLDVRVLDDRNSIEEISDDLKSTPITLKISNLPKYLDKTSNIETDTVAYRCLWTKNI